MWSSLIPTVHSRPTSDSPRLRYPAQAVDFAKEIVEVGPDAGL